MADLGRWFKLWIHARKDPHLRNLTLEQFARWCLLGCHIKEHGTGGTVAVPGDGRALCDAMEVPNLDEAKHAISAFPNVTFCDDGTVTIATVTWHNWQKYQGDNSAARTRAWRHRVTPKKRREEKRKEEKRSTPLTPSPKDPILPGEWETFGEHYPPHRFEDTPTARKTYRQVRKETSAEAILSALDRDRRSTDWKRDEGKFIPHPTKWLRRRRWNLREVSPDPDWEPPEQRAAKGDRTGLAVLFVKEPT